jgi:Mn2+/Fe2+ NRAMP family transporter
MPVGMKKLLEIALGVVTSIGGFLDAGAIATSLQAGARFRFQLIWATLLGTLCAIFLTEMSGRLAAVSKHPLRELIHKRFGFNFSIWLLFMGLLLNVLVIGSEIGGLAMALELATHISFRWWAIPAVFIIWLVLWLASFGVLEKAISFFGLVAIAFVIAAFRLHPDLGSVASGVLPTLPTHDSANYWFLSVSIIGAIVTPFMFFFYSSGAIEEHWNRGYIGVNRAVAGLGMSFGAAIAIGTIIVSALVLGPRGIRVENYHEAAGILTPVFGRWGLLLFLLSLGIASFGAAVEVSLSAAYEIAQSFGWNWGKSQKPASEARFTCSYSIILAVAALPVLLGIDPMKLTIFTMALACLELPFVTFPMLVVMNDRAYLEKYTNHRLANVVTVAIAGIAFLLAVVAIPLQIAGG